MTWIGFCIWFTFQVKNSEPIIKQTLIQKIGMPAKIGLVEIDWHGIFFELTLKDLTIIDPEIPVPFIHIEKARVMVNPIQYLWHQKIEFKKLSLDNVELSIGKEKDGSLVLRGLNNETLPSTIDVKALLSHLAKGNILEIKHAKIRWHLGGSEIKQRIDGDFYWINSKENAFMFEARHQIQVGESVPLPFVPLTLNINLAQSQGTLKTGNDTFNLQTTFFETPKGIDANCELSINALDVNSLSRYFALTDKDPEWAVWLTNAIEAGKIIQGNLTLSQVFQHFHWAGNMAVQNVKLRYNEKWPTIDHILGNINFKDRELTIVAAKSEILGIDTDRITTQIQNIGKTNQTHILVDGSLQGKIEKGIEFLRLTPLKEKVGEPLELLNPTGNMQLKLKLDIPLNEKETKVDGWLSTMDATITPLKGKKPLPLKGNFNFTENKVEAKIDQFQVSDLILNNTVIAMDSLQRDNQWKLAGPNITGVLSLPRRGTKENININLEHLKLTKQNNSTISSQSLLEENKPSILFLCQDFQYDDVRFGKVQVNLVPSKNGYDIINLSLGNSAYYLQAKGTWDWREEMRTTLMGDMLSTNMGSAFKQLGYPTMMRGARGRIKFNLSWPESLLQFNIQAVEGNADVKLHQGRILGVDPGLGRIFGLLNVDNIRRRLKLDFSDVYKKGFVYDTLSSHMQLSNGVVQVNDLLIGGPAANIEMQGKAQFKNKAIDLKMIVMPKLAVGLPAAGLVVGGPVGLAGGLVIDKLFGSKIIRHYYHVTGTWDSPSIDEIGYSSFKTK